MKETETKTEYQIRVTKLTVLPKDSPSCSLLDAARIAAKWMEWWLAETECECEYGHTCGKIQRENELRQIKAAILEAENDPGQAPAGR